MKRAWIGAAFLTAFLDGGKITVYNGNKKGVLPDG